MMLGGLCKIVLCPFEKKTQNNKPNKKTQTTPPATSVASLISNLLMFCNSKPGCAWSRGVQPACCDPGHHLELSLDIHVHGRLVWSQVQTCWKNPSTTCCRREKEQLGTAGGIQQDGLGEGVCETRGDTPNWLGREVGANCMGILTFLNFPA